MASVAGEKRSSSEAAASCTEITAEPPAKRKPLPIIDDASQQSDSEESATSSIAACGNCEKTERRGAKLDECDACGTVVCDRCTEQCSTCRTEYCALCSDGCPNTSCLTNQTESEDQSSSDLICENCKDVCKCEVDYYQCENCNGHFCEICINTCAHCGHHYCGDCVDANTNETFCVNCTECLDTDN